MGKPSPLTSVDYEILHLFYRYHFLIASQIVRLRYSEGSLTTVQTRLKKLGDQGALLRRKLPHTGTGNTEYIYFLSNLGQKLLTSAYDYTFPRVRKDEIEAMQKPHLDHLLSVNDFLIAATLLNRFDPQIELAEFRHDLDLKRSPVKVTVDSRIQKGKTEHVTVIPDSWLDFRMGGKRRVFCLELDRGTLTQEPMRKKIRAYYSYALSPEYVKLFGTDFIQVLYATTAGEKRLKNMLSWCEEELHQQDITEEANLYRFTALPSPIEALTLFTKEVWYAPFQDTPISLLWNVP